MLKQLIWFDDIKLFNDCEVEAKRHDLVSAQDFIIFSLQNYFKKIGEEKVYKKSIDLWLSCEKEARKLDVEIPMFIESVCRQAINGYQPTEVAQTGIVKTTDKKRGLFQRINDVMSLPRG